MQSVSANLRAELNKGQYDPRILVDLYELYESDYVPGVDGFDEADAVESFAAEEITWNGQAYRREFISRGDIVKNMDEKVNTVSLTFSNISRYMATLAHDQVIEGMFLVVRCVAPSVTDDSLVLFVGRCGKPGDIDKNEFSLSATTDFGNINQEIPPRLFIAEDPQGRTASDPLYEGFRIMPLSGSFQYPVTVPSTSFFGRLFGRTKQVMQTAQYSSLDTTPYGGVVPIIFGRCQMEGIPIFFADIGFFLIGVWAIGEGRLDDFTNTQVRDKRFTLQSERRAYGDPGGTGTNIYAINPSVWPQGAINHGYLSSTAYTVLSMSGSAGDTVDDAPTVTSLVRGMRVPLPDASGVFNQLGWTDNPVYIARFLLTDSRLVRIPEAFMEDLVNYNTGLHCDEPLIDDSNGEVTLLPAADQPLGGTEIRRFRSTGIIDARWWKYHELGDTSIIPDFEDADYTPFDLVDIPTTFGINRLLRKRYTFNAPITERTRAVDFLNKTVFPAAKLFLRVNKKGKYEIRTERPSDNTMITTAISVSATVISVLDVTPWKTGDLLTGRIHLGFGLTTSEVRNVSSATYSTAGNAVTLSAGSTGGVTATASGANLTGGSTTVQASGTITIGGSPGAGDTVTATIKGIASVHTLNSDDTTGTAAAMLAAYINANPQLRRYVLAVWNSGSPTVITIRAKHGTLNVDSALLQAHTAPIADPVSTTPSLSSSAGALGAGTYKLAYSDVTALGKTALSPTASIVLTASKQIDVGAITLVGVSRNWYMSDAANSDYLKFVANTNGSAFSINALPLDGAALPPSYNTTGEELIRVAMSFATNSQDIYSAWSASTLVIVSEIRLPTIPNGHKYDVSAITTGITGTTEPTFPLTAGGTVVDGGVTWREIGATVLGQAGLTRANIKKDTFKYPLGSRQSSVNQIKIPYRDSNNDFALTPLRINDRAHQTQVNKIYPLDVDGSGIDNFHQCFRIGNWMLAKNREGDWFDTFGTGPQGLVLEEGDVICASDDSGGLVNQVTRIEELRIHPNHDVTIAQARKYSTLMFADEVGSDVIPVPTTLRFTATADSIVEFIDNHPIRDEHGLTGGFYAVVSRDLTVEGDWRGWALYADYGDGYVQIAEGDIPSYIGTATTTLGSVTDPSAWDRINSITFTLKYGPVAPFAAPFVTVPEQDLLASAYRNLFLIGNEYIQAATVVDNGNLSYTISTLLRGRFGSDGTELTHSASERVVFLDGSEVFVRIDVVRLNGSFNYKAVTTNQDVAGATAVPFTWTGGNLRPLAPVNLRGTRNSIGDLYLEWTRRSRFGSGMTPGSDVPLAEEFEQYDVELLTTGDVLKRTMRVLPGGAQAAIILPEFAQYAPTINGNSITSTASNSVAFTKQQLVNSGGWVEATLHLTSAPQSVFLSLFDPSDLGTNQTNVHPFYQLRFSNINAGSVTTFEISVSGANVFTSASFSGLRDARIRVVAVGSEVRFYWDYLGAGSLPVYVATLGAQFPLVPRFNLIGASELTHAYVGSNSLHASTIYSNEQQTADGFTPNVSTVRVKVCQISSIVGRGPFVSADF